MSATREILGRPGAWKEETFELGEHGTKGFHGPLRSHNECAVVAVGGVVEFA